MGFRVGILAGVAMTIAAACMFGLAPAQAVAAGRDPAGLRSDQCHVRHRDPRAGRNQVERPEGRNVEPKNEVSRAADMQVEIRSSHC